MDEMLTIGVFSKRCGLTRSALRFYDEAGLLRPVTVDDVTGYRWYAAAQLETAGLIRELREADMPVEAVRVFLDADPAQRRTLLEVHIEMIETQAAKLRRSVRLVRDRLEADHDAASSCRLSGPQLRSVLDQVLFAVSRDDGRPGLTGVLLEAKEDTLRVVTTDRHRLAIRDLVPDGSISPGGFRALVPAAPLDGLRTSLGLADRCVLRRRGGSVEVDLDGSVVSLPLIPEAFPDYEKILNGTAGEAHGVIDRRALLAALRRGGPAAVTLAFSADDIVMSAEGSVTPVGRGWNGPDLTVKLNSTFLEDISHAHVGPDVIVEASGPLNPVTLRSADHGTFTVLLMPIRPDS
jgi:DNA polymerase-3 subunit beta